MKYSLSYEALNLICANITPLLAHVAEGDEAEMGSSESRHVTLTPFSLGPAHVLLWQIIYPIVLCL